MLNFRKPTSNDLELYFEWANDPQVRKQSYNSALIDLENHKKWFKAALNNDLLYMYIFENEYHEKVGQIRIQKQSLKEALIGISIASNHRGKGYAKEMLVLATNSFLKSNKDFLINAYIKESNINSKISFEKGGFQFKEMILFENINSFHYIKTARNED
ncbi:GNAT family N-acetyltransferase [Flavobacterium aquidurense]|uniref:GNAT family N-acetyltransferase n=1 Tax=Flavobacterium aquidurense TaxID=362413 RepID=UPI0028632B8D|nr:GNAT family N-acetyltransferase [Flavobacterium aquidurense]MDR7372358.1 RimJ/RimL family protein N-acetyltransferase [Flavobacterium aquidurense]